MRLRSAAKIFECVVVEPDNFIISNTESHDGGTGNCTAVHKCRILLSQSSIMNTVAAQGTATCTCVNKVVMCLLHVCVRVCGNIWKPPSNQKPVPVLLACAVDLNTPGDYKLTFSVTNSAGLTSAVSRVITVKAVCLQGESLCSDQVTTRNFVCSQTHSRSLAANHLSCADGCDKLLH